MAARSNSCGYDSILDEELDVLRAIYIHELVVEEDDSGHPHLVYLTLHPSTGDDVTKQFVCLTVHFKLPPSYPDDIPEVIIKNPRGLSEEELHSLQEDMHTLAESRSGSAMLFELIEMAKEILTEGNIPRCPCVVCLEHFHDADTFTRTDCYHYFHYSCLARYVHHALIQEPEVKVMHAKKEAEEPKVICPVCRHVLNYDLEVLEQFPSEQDEVVPYKPNEDMVKLQQDMAELYVRQKANGGIIDLEVEKNRYLVNKDTVVTMKVEIPEEPDPPKKKTTMRSERKSPSRGGPDRRNHQNSSVVAKYKGLPRRNRPNNGYNDRREPNRHPRDGEITFVGAKDTVKHRHHAPEHGERKREGEIVFVGVKDTTKHGHNAHEHGERKREGEIVFVGVKDTTKHGHDAHGERKRDDNGKGSSCSGRKDYDNRIKNSHWREQESRDRGYGRHRDRYEHSGHREDRNRNHHAIINGSDKSHSGKTGTVVIDKHEHRQQDGDVENRSASLSATKDTDNAVRTNTNVTEEDCEKGRTLVTEDRIDDEASPRDSGQSENDKPGTSIKEIPPSRNENHTKSGKKEFEDWDAERTVVSCSESRNCSSPQEGDLKDKTPKPEKSPMDDTNDESETKQTGNSSRSHEAKPKKPSHEDWDRELTHAGDQRERRSQEKYGGRRRTSEDEETSVDGDRRRGQRSKDSKSSRDKDRETFAGRKGDGRRYKREEQFEDRLHDGNAHREDHSGNNQHHGNHRDRNRHHREQHLAERIHDREDNREDSRRNQQHGYHRDGGQGRNRHYKDQWHGDHQDRARHEGRHNHSYKPHEENWENEISPVERGEKDDKCKPDGEHRDVRKTDPSKSALENWESDVSLKDHGKNENSKKEEDLLMEKEGKHPGGNNKYERRCPETSRHGVTEGSRLGEDSTRERRSDRKDIQHDRSWDKGASRGEQTHGRGRYSDKHERRHEDVHSQDARKAKDTSREEMLHPRRNYSARKENGNEDHHTGQRDKNRYGRMRFTTSEDWDKERVDESRHERNNRDGTSGHGGQSRQGSGHGRSTPKGRENQDSNTNKVHSRHEGNRVTPSHTKDVHCKPDTSKRKDVTNASERSETKPKPVPGTNPGHNGKEDNCKASSRTNDTHSKSETSKGNNVPNTSEDPGRDSKSVLGPPPGINLPPGIQITGPPGFRPVNAEGSSTHMKPPPAFVVR